jgi:dolichol kinase
MVIEGLEFKINGFKIDDNLLIPLTAGLILHFCFLFF